MAIERRRFRASFVVVLTAIYVATSVGCATGPWRQTTPSAAAEMAAHRARLDRRIDQASAEAALRRLPFVETAAPTPSPAQNAGDELLFNDVVIGERSYFDGDDVQLDDIVRGQGQYYGPLKEFAFNPYVIGAIIVAAIVVPIAIDPRDRPVNTMGGGGNMNMGN